MWGGRCRQIVNPPTYSHGAHPNKAEQAAPAAPAAAVAALASPSNPIWAISAALHSRQCPPAAIAQVEATPHLYRDQQLMRLVALHPNTRPETLVDIEQRDDQVAPWALANPNYDLAHLNIERLDPARRSLVAINPKLGEDRQTELVRAGSGADVALRPWPLAPAVQREIARTGSGAPGLAVRPDMLPELAQQFADSPDTNGELWAGLAGNPFCPPEVLSQMVGRSDRIDMVLAGNPACPTEVLDKLAEHTDPYVRAEVLAAANRSDDALAALIRDDNETIKDEAVAIWAAANPTLAMVRRFALDLF